MKIFFDETGEFSCGHPAVSLAVGLVVPDRASNGLFERFRAWRESQIGTSKQELKGSELDNAQLLSFVDAVFPSSDRQAFLTVVGTDTTVTEESYVNEARNQLSQQYNHLAKLLLDYTPPNRKLAQAYTECAGWTKKRSTANFVWIVVMETVIYEALQLMVCAFMEPEDDEEFLSIELSVDRSFIKEPAPIQFWIEYIRNARSTRAKKGLAFIIPNTWRLRQHPYVQRFSSDDGISDISDLIRNHLNFVDSKTSPGVQIADIGAHIVGRFHRGENQLAAYHRLESRIIGREGAKIRLIHFDQSSLSSNPTASVRLRSIEEQKAVIRESNRLNQKS